MAQQEGREKELRSEEVQMGPGGRSFGGDATHPETMAVGRCFAKVPKVASRRLFPRRENVWTRRQRCPGYTGSKWWARATVWKQRKGGAR